MTQQRKWFTPAEGMKVPHPQTHDHVPAKGMWVFDDIYWHRREAEGAGKLSEAPPEGHDDE